MLPRLDFDSPLPFGSMRSDLATRIANRSTSSQNELVARLRPDPALPTRIRRKDTVDRVVGEFDKSRACCDMGDSDRFLCYFRHFRIFELHFRRLCMSTDSLDQWDPETTTGYGQPPVIEDLKDEEPHDQCSF